LPLEVLDEVWDLDILKHQLAQDQRFLLVLLLNHKGRLFLALLVDDQLFVLDVGLDEVHLARERVFQEFNRCKADISGLVFADFGLEEQHFTTFPEDLQADV